MNNNQDDYERPSNKSIAIVLTALLMLAAVSITYRANQVLPGMFGEHHITMEEQCQ